MSSFVSSVSTAMVAAVSVRIKVDLGNFCLFGRSANRRQEGSIGALHRSIPTQPALLLFKFLPFIFLQKGSERLCCGQTTVIQRQSPSYLIRLVEIHINALLKGMHDDDDNSLTPAQLNLGLASPKY